MSGVLQALQAARAKIRGDLVSQRNGFIELCQAGRSGIRPELVGQAKGIRPFVYNGKTSRSLVSSGNYVTGDSVKFAVCKRSDGAFTVSDKHESNVIAVTHIGLEYNYTLQLATLMELLELARVKIEHEAQGMTPLPLRASEIFVGQVAQVGSKVDMASGAGTATYGADLYVPANRVSQHPLFELPEPLVIQPDERALIILEGLAGTVAGSSPALTARPVFAGFETING
jgi:hypothetical protein